MNIYVVVEGEIGEKKLYEQWIPYVNKNLSYVPTINQVSSNNFFIQRGGGFPNYFGVIKDAITDVRNLKNAQEMPLFDRLVIVIDSEDYTFNQKMLEIVDYVTPIIGNTYLDYKVIIQHFCLETWGLANKKITTSNIQNVKLLNYKKIFDVALNDPENLPDLIEEDLNRAQFASKYLRLLLNNKFRNLTYNKSDPGPLINQKYYNEVLNRHTTDMHITSFGTFLSAFI